MVTSAADAGVTRMVTMGVDAARSRTAIALARGHNEVWAGVGHHPTEASTPDLDVLRELARDPRVVAIGEIGLDFEEAGAPPRHVQVSRLNQLCELAVELDLPVSIHNRGAATEILDVIDGHPGLRGVMHYFALEWEWAQRFLDLGFSLGFAGLVTRPSRNSLREVARQCPDDRLLLETDSPYGNAHKRMGVPNRPEYLIDTAELVAELRGVGLQELAKLERDNALRVFSRMT
ncbi:MAG TPA: TatD family hydrolase [Candidatus Dormibacteraeota bacterium]